MATTVTPQSLTTAPSGLELTAVTASAPGTKDQAANPNGDLYVIVHNGSGSDIDMTFETHKTVGGAALTVPDQTKTVTAATSQIFGPFSKDIFNDGDGNVVFFPSLETSITYNVFTS